MMDVRPIETEADYDWALCEIERYFDDEPVAGTVEAARFSVLSALIAHYEDRRSPIEAPDAVEAIREVMRLRQMTQADLGALLGSRSRASELLRGKRGLTMEQAWKLHTAWRIPADLLFRPATTSLDGTRVCGAEGEATTTKRGGRVAQRVPATPGFDRDKARSAAAGLREASRDTRLCGIEIKDLVNEGRS